MNFNTVVRVADKYDPYCNCIQYINGLWMKQIDGEDYHIKSIRKGFLGSAREWVILKLTSIDPVLKVKHYKIVYDDYDSEQEAVFVLSKMTIETMGIKNPKSYQRSDLDTK